MNKFQSFCGYASITALSVSLGIPGASAEENDPSVRDGRLDTIVVVGEKTDRSLKETTSSVSVISQDDLRTMQYHTVSDAVSDLSNVVTLTGAVPDIRGVKGNGAAGGFNSISGGAKARVSMLIDGVAEPFVSDWTGDSGLWDIEQVEVYRGPQSTSNGRNSIGGSIYIKTADPSFEQEGAVRLGYRNQDRYVDTSVMLSGPVIEDKLAFRISAQRVDADTFSADKGFDSNPAPYDLNGIETQRLRGKLLWVVNEDTDLLLTHSSNNEQGAGGRTFYDAKDPWQFERLYHRDIETDSDVTSLKLDTQINDGMSLDVLLAHMDYQWGFDTYEPVPADQQQLMFDEKSLTLDAKLNFGLDNDTMNGFVGLAWFERTQDIKSEGAYPYYGDDKSDSAAIYGEVNYALNERFNLIAGGRLEREAQKRDFVYDPIDATLDNSKTIFLPKLALQYAADDLTTLSFSVRQGYNAGGGALNFSAQEYYYYDEETVDSYEISLRRSSADGQLDLVANVFYNDYDGYQAQNSMRSIVNMDRAITYGAELEAVLRPRNDIQLKAGLGLLRTEIKDGGANYASANGNELNSAPDVTASLGLDYWVNDDLNLGVSVKYVSEYFGDLENTDTRVAGDYTVTRLNANYETGNWLLAAFINNAFDEKAFTTVDPASRIYPDGYVAVVEPRNVGVSVTYSF